jgi:8-oxo-dGTP pyrophosphatase MutT (NUDIX family)
LRQKGRYSAPFFYCHAEVQDLFHNGSNASSLITMSQSLFDPMTAAIEAIVDEAAVPLERLSVNWLRTHFARPPLWAPETTDEHSQRQRQADTNMRRAAVLIPLVLREDGLHLLLTQRAAHLSAHGGQISLPGGRQEPTDISATETALREAHEEIGLHPRHVEVIGVLPEYWTGSGYRITPVVGLVNPPIILKPNPDEVDEIFEVPFAFLMNGINHQRRTATFSSGSRTFYAMPYERFFIWGATAAILRNLLHFLRA